MLRTLPLFIATLIPGQLLASDQVALNNSIFVERVSTDANGRQRVSLEQSKIVVPGDRIVFVLNYRNNGSKPANRFVVTNPLPAAVRFQGVDESQAIVSVDGGKAWGALSDLNIQNADGTSRPAQPADVTHIRWAFQKPIPAGGSGKLMFRGVVR